MKKTTTKKSSLRGSDLAWLLKADCTDLAVRVNGFGPILPPLGGSLVHGVPVPFFILSEEAVKAETLTHCPPPLHLCSSFLQWKGMKRLFWKPPAIPYWFYTDPSPTASLGDPSLLLVLCHFNPLPWIFCFSSSDFLQNSFPITTISSLLTS